MPETCKNWPGFVNSCVYYSSQTHDIYQVLRYPVDFKAPEEFEIYHVIQYLVNVVLFKIKDLLTSEMPVKLKSNLYAGPVNIYPNFVTADIWCK